MKIRLAVLLVAILNCFATAQAQASPTPVPMPQTSAILLGSAEAAKTGAPYSLTREMRRHSTLADGTQIEEGPSVVKMYRDSEGRTRTEIYKRLTAADTEPELMSVVIADNVAKERFVLNVRDNTVTKAEIRQVWQTVNGAGGIVRAPAASGAATQTMPARVQLEPPIRKSLGTQEVAGITVEGTETTMTYPVGAIGNDRPISTDRVVWVSAELGIEMLMTYNDPRMGTTTIRVTEISRTEPDASLFQVPADYTLVTPQDKQ